MPREIPGPLVLYDGHCGFCARSVRWLLGRDRHAALRFAPLQGDTAAPILARYGVPADQEFRTMLVVEHVGEAGERLHQRSDGALIALRAIGGGWRALAAAGRLVPRVLRDAVYDFIAARRFRWFGRLERQGWLGHALPVPGRGNAHARGAAPRCSKLRGFRGAGPATPTEVRSA